MICFLIFFKDQFPYIMALQCARAASIKDSGVLNAFIRETCVENDVFCHDLEPRGEYQVKIPAI